MTSLKFRPARSPTATPPPDGRQKDVLFCPACGHESPVDGDWAVEQPDGGRTVRCPECETVVTSRDA